MRLVSLQVGQPISCTFSGREVMSGIYKTGVSSPLFLSSINFEGDRQADLENHGGPDKAVNAYSAEHYPYWEKRLGRQLEGGAFGENMTLLGMTEDAVCIGDIYRIGEAVVQISQPRQPCYKLAGKHDVQELPLQVQTSGYTGYYFRVLQEGLVPPQTEVRLVDRHPAGVTVAFVNRIKYDDRTNREAMERLIALAELSAGWRESFRSRLAGL